MVILFMYLDNNCCEYMFSFIEFIKLLKKTIFKTINYIPVIT